MAILKTLTDTAVNHVAKSKSKLFTDPNDPTQYNLNPCLF